MQIGADIVRLFIRLSEEKVRNAESSHAKRICFIFLYYFDSSARLNLKF